MSAVAADKHGTYFSWQERINEQNASYIASGFCRACGLMVVGGLGGIVGLDIILNGNCHRL